VQGCNGCVVPGMAQGQNSVVDSFRGQAFQFICSDKMSGPAWVAGVGCGLKVAHLYGTVSCDWIC
jgi:hypothetical protein